MTLFQALCIGLLGYFGVNRVPWLFGQSGGFNGIAQPLVACTIIGALFGRVEQGIAVGAALQAMYLGVIQPGGALPSDRGFATFIGGSLAIASNTGVEGAIALAVPLGLLGVALFQLCMTFNAAFVHLGDKAAAEGNRDGIVRAQYLAQVPTFLIYVTIYTIANYAGVSFVEAMIAALPQQIIKALSIMGGILPSIGFAMLLKYILSDKQEWMLVFFIMGFLIVKNTSFNIVSLALFGIAVSLVYVMARYGGFSTGVKQVQSIGGKEYDE